MRSQPRSKENSILPNGRLSVTSDLLSHPILNLPDEPIANFFKTIIQQQFSLSAMDKSLSALLNEIIFEGQNPNLIKQKYKNFNISFDVICGQTIPKKTAHYFCLDCDRVSREEKTLVGAMCQQCFLGSNHEGHRVILRKNKYNIGQCYCGDSSIFESSAFCKQHAKQSLAYEEVQTKLGEAFITKFTNTLKMCLYGLCALAELYEKGKDTPKRSALRETLGVLLDQVLEFCNFCSNDLSSMFLVVISRMFMSKFLPEYNKLWHYCNDLKGKKGFSDAEIPCTCCIFEVFMRNISLVDTCVQLVFLFRNLCKDNEFRQFMAVIYVKYLHYIFLNDNPKRRSLTLSHSRFAKMSLELYAGSDLCEIALKSGYTIHIFEILEDVLLKCTCLQGRFMSLVYELKVLLEYMMRPHTNSCKLVLKNNYILIIMVDLIAGLGDAHIYTSPITLKMSKEDINYSFINDSLQCEGLVSGILRRSILQLDELDEREREGGMTKLCLYWKESYNQKLRKDKKRDPKKYCFHPVLERLLQQIIRETQFEVSKDYVKTFITTKLGVKEQVLAENIVEGLVKPFGAFKHIAFIDNSSYDQVFSTYNCPSYNLFDNDILTIQMFLPFLPADKAYESLVTHYFSYSKEITEFLLESKPFPAKENSANLVVLIQEFFQFLIHIMTDEICLANNLFTREPQLYVEQHESNDKIKKITKKVIVNILSCYTWVDLSILINQVKSVLHIQSIDDTLAEVAILDEKTQKLRIKEDHFHDYDPYMFFGRKVLQAELEHQFLEKMRGSTNIDMLSGFYYTGLPDHLYEIQHAVLGGPLFDFIVKIFVEDNDKYTGLKRISLKLILSTLNCAEYLISCFRDCKSLLKQINANLEDGTLMSKLNSLKEHTNFADCGIIIENIKEAIDRLRDFEVEASPRLYRPSAMITGADKASMIIPEEVRKDSMDGFHKESIEAYKKKREIGRRTRSNEFLEDEESLVVCNYCSKAIDDKDTQCGVPVFLSLTNTVGRNVHTELEQTRYPVIYSCLHFFHEGCISQAGKSPTVLQNQANILKERFCPVCNSVYNYFMVTNASTFGSCEKIPVSPSGAQYLHLLTILGYMMENSDWYEEEALQELSDEPAYTRQGVSAISSALMFFVDTVDFNAGFEQLIKEVEVFSWVMRAVKSHLERDEDDMELVFKGRKFNNSENPEKVLCNNAVQAIILHAHEDRIFIEKIKKLLSEYIIKKALEKISLTHEKSSYNTNKLLFKLFDSALTISFKNAKLYKEVVSVLKKLVLIYVIGVSMYSPMRGDRIQALLQTLYDPELSTPDSLLKTLNIQVKPEEFLKDLLFNVDASNYEPTYSKDDGKKLKVTDGVLFNLYKLDPCLIDMPKSYLEFISKYFKARCSICSQVPENGEEAVCLMCGEIFCMRKCSKQPSMDDNGFSLEGNLSRHRRKKHAGNGLFLEISTMMVVMIYGNRSLSYMGLTLYCDAMGQNVKNIVAHPFDRQLDSLDFRRFLLGKDAHIYLQKLLKKNLLPREQLQLGKGNEAVFFGNEL